jgi:hypothetical protein
MLGHVEEVCDVHFDDARAITRVDRQRSAGERDDLTNAWLGEALAQHFAARRAARPPHGSSQRPQT